MCRFLMMRGEAPFDASRVLAAFSERCRDSREFQGHGWGASWRQNGTWERTRSLTPIWEDLRELPAGVDFLIVHARSAFRNQGIALSNNMPFYRGKLTFVFNGELHRVRLSVPGRIGAEKIFRLVEARHSEGLERALAAADRMLRAKSRRVRALNMALSDGENIYASCRFDESPDYFTLHTRRDSVVAVCSEPLDARFRPMANGSRVVL